MPLKRNDVWLHQVDKNIKKKAIEIQNSILNVLADFWDPIGIGGDPIADKEYEGYVGKLYRILVSNPSEEILINCLTEIEVEEIGEETTLETKKTTAKELLKINVFLKEER